MMRSCAIYRRRYTPPYPPPSRAEIWDLSDVTQEKVDLVAQGWIFAFGILDVF